MTQRKGQMLMKIGKKNMIVKQENSVKFNADNESTIITTRTEKLETMREQQRNRYQSKERTCIILNGA